MFHSKRAFFLLLVCVAFLPLFSGCRAPNPEKSSFLPGSVSVGRAAERRTLRRIVCLTDGTESVRIRTRVRTVVSERGWNVEFRAVEHDRIAGLLRGGYADLGIGTFSEEEVREIHLCLREKGFLLRTGDRELLDLFDGEK